MDVAFTDRELDVMGVLWQLGAGSVAEVRDLMPDPLAYNTVLTVLRTLEAKGYVRHAKDGKAYRYSPTVKREVAGRSALQRLLGPLFRGSPELLLAQLVDDQHVGLDEVRRLRQVLDDRLRQSGRGNS